MLNFIGSSNVHQECRVITFYVYLGNSVHMSLIVLQMLGGLIALLRSGHRRTAASGIRPRRHFTGSGVQTQHADGKSIKSYVAYLTKKNKISPRSPALATMQIAAKICQGQLPTVYSECSRFHPNRFTFGGVISERVNTVRARWKVNPIFG